MKKIFCIVASVIIAFVGVFLTVLGCVKKSLAFDYDEPYAINVYNKSTASLNNGTSYYKGDTEYSKILEMLGKTTRVSLLTLLVRTGSVNYKIKYGGDDYATYNTEMNSKNIVIELIYRKERNVVVYDGKNTRVIPYYCVLYVIPTKSKFEEIIVYNSLTSDSTDNKKIKEYQSNKPFVIKGNPKKIISYVNSLT